MFKRSQRSSLKSAAKRGAGVLLHLCLLVSLWRAPVPWVHSHDSIDRRTAATRFWAEHLDHFHTHRFHTDPNHFGSETTEAHGWHLHFVLPWELADKHDDAEHPRGVPESLRVESDQLSSAWTAIVRAESDQGRVIVAEPVMVAQSGPIAPTLSRPVGVQVLLTYSDRISWRALACVARANSLSAIERYFLRNSFVAAQERIDFAHRALHFDQDISSAINANSINQWDGR